MWLKVSVLMLLSLIAVPVALGVHLCINWILGDTEFVHVFVYESKQMAIQRLLLDLHISMMISAAILVSLALLSRLTKKRYRSITLLTAMVAIVMAAYLITASQLVVFLTIVCCGFYSLWHGYFKLRER